jgi:nucleotide-binding universal stress UspA family protein
MARRILVPLDRSAAAAAVIPVVADMARGAGSTVRLLHVAAEPRTQVDDDGRVLAFADQEAERIEAEAIDFLRALARTAPDLRVECAVRFGDPVAEILTEADEAAADLIVVTTCTRGGVTRTIRRSVGEQVLDRADRPVMLVRHAELAAA